MYKLQCPNFYILFTTILVQFDAHRKHTRKIRIKTTTNKATKKNRTKFGKNSENEICLKNRKKTENSKLLENMNTLSYLV